MRTFKLLLPGDQSVTFTNKWWVELRKGNLTSLVSLLSVVSFGLLLGFVVLLPFVFTASPDVETKMAYYLLFVVLGLLGTTIGLIFLSGWKVLVDPVGLVGILFFALLSIMAFLFAQATKGNTLGAPTMKYLGAIYLMVLIALFYFTVLFTNTRRRFALLLNAVLISFMLVLVARFFYEIGGVIVERDLLTNVFYSTITTSSFIWVMGVMYGNRFWKYVSAILLAIALWLSFASKPQNLSVGAWSQIAVLIALVLALLIALRSKQWQVGNAISQLRHNIVFLLKRDINLGTFLSRSEVILLAAAVVGWLVLMVVWFANNRLGLQIFPDLITDYRNGFTELTDVTQLLVGRGAGINLKDATLSSVVGFQGLLGLLAYAILIISTIVLAVRTFAKSVNWKVRAIAGWLVITALLMLVTKVYLFAVILWWVGLGIMAVANTDLGSKPDLSVIKNLKLVRIFSALQTRRLQVVIVIVLLVAWLLATRWLFGQAQFGSI
jgi:hypothetical protein